MPMNPYEVLGVSENASLDEVKKAYRKKARENHPDLNPDDPNASEKIKQINEAYDRITNPEKYARKRVATSGPTPSSPFGGPGNAGYGYGYGYGWPAGNGSGTGSTSSGAGPGYAWTTTTFTWDDIFGSDWVNAGPADPGSIHPEASTSDSPEIRKAIAAFNANDFVTALSLLGSVPHPKRNARWYYLSALANYKNGSTTTAFGHIRRARNMDPTNMDYLRAYQSFQQPGTAYQEAGQSYGFGMNGTTCTQCCCGLMCAQAFCYPVVLCC